MDFIQIFYYDISYYIIAVLLCLLYIVLDKKSNKFKWIDIIAIIVLVGFSALRYNVGSDYQEYLIRYQYITDNWLVIEPRLVDEKLFYYLCYLFSSIFEGPYGIFWLAALLQYPILVYISRKLFGRPSLIIFCYVMLELYAMSNNILRQSISIEFVMIGYLSWLYHKKSLSIIFFLLSLGFHATAALGIALLFISRLIKPNKSSLYISILFGILLVISWKPLIRYLSVIPLIGRYSGYFDQQGALIMRQGMIGFILFYAYLALFLIKFKKYIKLDKEVYLNSISFVIASIPIFFIAMQITYIYRLTLYLTVFCIFAIPIMIQNLKFSSKKQKYRFVIHLFLVLSIWFLYANVMSLDNTYWQYSFQIL